MPAAPYAIAIEQGAKYRTTLTLTDRDLTGCSARMQVREAFTSPQALLDLSSEPGEGITITPGPPGVIEIVITSVQTAAMTWRSGVYDLELTDAGGEVERLLEGSVTVSPEVTR
jgi:hypothetical protein